MEQLEENSITIHITWEQLFIWQCGESLCKFHETGETKKFLLNGTVRLHTGVNFGENN